MPARSARLGSHKGPSDVYWLINDSGSEVVETGSEVVEKVKKVVQTQSEVVENPSEVVEKEPEVVDTVSISSVFPTARQK